MTALYFAHLDAADRVSVKPHASPVLPRHPVPARQPRPLLPDRGCAPAAACSPTRRRTKDPDRVDFSTGSVGLGAAAPLFAAAVRRYVDAHFGAAPALAGSSR